MARRHIPEKQALQGLREKKSRLLASKASCGQPACHLQASTQSSARSTAAACLALQHPHVPQGCSPGAGPAGTGHQPGAGSSRLLNPRWMQGRFQPMLRGLQPWFHLGMCWELMIKKKRSICPCVPPIASPVDAQDTLLKA